MALWLGLTVLVVGGAGATFLVARQLGKPNTTVTTKTPPPKPSGAAATGAAQKPPVKQSWPAARRDRGRDRRHRREVRGATACACSRREKRDAARVRDQVRAILDELRAWLASSDVPAARALAADFHPPPLNLVIVPQKLLDDGSLFPDLPTNEGSTYAYRYIEKKRTLFVNDTKGFEQQDLPDGVALHVLTWVPALTNEEVLRLAGKVCAALQVEDEVITCPQRLSDGSAKFRSPSLWSEQHVSDRYRVSTVSAETYVE